MFFQSKAGLEHLERDNYVDSVGWLHNIAYRQIREKLPKDQENFHPKKRNTGFVFWELFLPLGKLQFLAHQDEIIKILTPMFSSFAKVPNGDSGFVGYFLEKGREASSFHQR